MPLNALAPFDYNRAIGQGTQNALGQMQFMNAAQSNALARRKFNLAEQQANTDWLINATDNVLQNPSLLPAMVQEGKQRGIIQPNFNHGSVTIDDVQKLNQRLKMGMAQQKQQNPYGKINPSEYTPESIAQFNKSGDYSALVAKPKGPLVTVATGDMIPESQKAYGKEIGKANAGQYLDIQKGAADSVRQNAQLERLNMLLDNTYTGTGAVTTMKLKRAAKSMGVDLGLLGITDNVAPAEAAQALSSQMALELRNPAGGAGMPGAMSDKDREFLQSMVPALGNTKEGRLLMIQTYKKINQRNQVIAKMAREYAKNHNGMFDEGFTQVLTDYANRNPLFSSQDFAKLGEQGAIPMPNTQADYGALPSGSIYIDPEDGKQYRKP